MFEKVNPSHPDKIADRIAGAIVDIAYSIEFAPRVAVEVLIGHGICHVVIETNLDLTPFRPQITRAISRIAGDVYPDINIVSQDERLSQNQKDSSKCADNGIFRGAPPTNEERMLTKIARDIYSIYPYDGKYLITNDRLIICQSNYKSGFIEKEYPYAEINPIGYWTGGTGVDTGASNRKLGSDMGSAVTGGGLHGKDLSKADVTLNICAHLKAMNNGEPVEIACSIGQEKIDGMPYIELMNIAKQYIDEKGGFEKFAEWGLIR